MKTILVILCVFLLNFNLLYADYIAVSMDSVNLFNGSGTIKARMKLDRKIIEGFATLTKLTLVEEEGKEVLKEEEVREEDVRQSVAVLHKFEGGKEIIIRSDRYDDEETKGMGIKGLYMLKIKWTSMIGEGGTLPIKSGGLFTEQEVSYPSIKEGTQLLLQGELSENLIGSLIKEEKEKEEKPRPPISSGRSGGDTVIGGNMSNPTESKPDTEMKQPDLVNTFDGCNHLYNKEQEVISVFQQTYYMDEKNQKNKVEDCHKVMELPAERKECSMKHDFIAHVSYTRYQPYFTEGGRNYSVGGCTMDQAYVHQFNSDVCDVIAIEGQYIKQGKWYYALPNGDKVYISDCVIDPNGDRHGLKIKYEGCPVYHDEAMSQSKHLGRYYYIKPSGEQVMVGDCIDMGAEGYFPHNVEWTKKFEHHIPDGFSYRIEKIFIKIPTENNRVIVVNPAKVSEVKMKHEWQKSERKSWENFDGKGSRLYKYNERTKGYSVEHIQKYIDYMANKYYVDSIYDRNDDSTKHASIKWQGNGSDDSCKYNKTRFYYIDTIKRPDNTTYYGDNYDSGC